jgi:uncharacterized membrane protein YagU involved in acid resistance
MWRNVVLGTIIVGFLDIAEVIVFYAFRDVKPIRILQSIAAGVTGRDRAFSGGTETAAFGLFLHFFIAFVVVLIYHLAARRIRALSEHPFVMGTLYGLAVYVVMNFVIVPMSAAGQSGRGTWPVMANVIFAHVACVGIPTALLAPQRKT